MQELIAQTHASNWTNTDTPRQASKNAAPKNDFIQSPCSKLRHRFSDHFPFSNNPPLTFKCSSSPFFDWVTNRFVSLWIRVLGDIVKYWIRRMSCLYSFAGWWRGGISGKNLACKCNIEVSFLVYVFLFLSQISVWIQNTPGIVYFLHVKVAFLSSRLFLVGVDPHTQVLF